MTKIEAKFFSFIQKNVVVVLFALASIVGIVVHIYGLDFQSDDFNSFLNGWWFQIKDGGLGGLANQVGNYNIPYQIITYLLTLTSLSALKAYKLLSILFDFILAGSASLLVYDFSKKSGSKSALMKAVLTYAAVLCSVTVILNSSFWAQCDSIYVSFILLGIYFTKKDRNILAFVMLGIAFSFKLQTVFIIPLFIYYYIANRKFSILHFFIIPLTDIVMCLPAVLLGRPIMDIFTIYAEQTDYGKLIQMNCPNFWSMICDGNDMTYYFMFKNISIFATMLILGVGLAMIIYKKIDLSDNHNLMLTGIWTVFTCIMFLSSMHERYGYLLDVLAVIYAFAFMKRFWLPVLCQLISIRGYAYYLFAFVLVDLKIAAIVYFALYIFVTVMFVREVVLNGRKLEIVAKANSDNTKENTKVST